MSNLKMTSLQRVLTALSHQEPDRVPFFLLLTMHGATLHGVSIREYFSQPELVADAQIRLREKFGHDCLYAFHYAAVECEAWGAEVIYRDDGPPNTGEPFIRRPDDIRRLACPDVSAAPSLTKVCRAIRLMKERIGDQAPIIGVVMSPFSLPVMQMGFESYIELMYEQPDLFERLMQINEDFCVAWANAQLQAGATAICYFDPVSSATIVSPDLYRKTGCEIACRTIARIKGPTATHFASGRCLSIVDDVARTGTAVVGVSVEESLAQLKQKTRGKLSLLGNLNAIAMRRWTASEAERQVREIIAQAAPGGGFIISDNHGEIPLQISDDVLMSIAETVRRYGTYPIR
ncbi:MAG TPA: uroporphyrinogen decarboxylase family protein [Candidatus Ozemobacteraceae bacterium]|nr:uroporphyrinogen decarboxylase family protein [Candidatus Ozemobacteraceae bacterium]